MELHYQISYLLLNLKSNGISSFSRRMNENQIINQVKGEDIQHKFISRNAKYN